MRGRIGIVVGFAAGYVLGSRAGKERYEQIKTQWLKLWNAEPVQKQVAKAKEFGKSAAFAVPSAVWDGTVKVVKAAADKKGSAGDKLDAAAQQSKKSAKDVADAVEDSAAVAKSGQ